MDPEDLRAAIPACDRGVYLNTGASGPAPRHVVDATADFLDHHEYVAPVEEGAYPAAFETFDETREDLGRGVRCWGHARSAYPPDRFFR